MVEQPTRMITASAAGGSPSWPSAGLNQRNVQIRFQLVEPANQTATGESSADDGKINFSHVR